DSTACGRKENGSGASGQIACAEIARIGMDPGKDHDPVFARFWDRVTDMPACGGERAGEEAASGAGLGFSEDKNLLGAGGQPRKLPFGTLLGRVSDVKRQE